MSAKRAEIRFKGVLNPSDSDVIKQITSDEVSRHCKRATRGTRETTSLISDLLASLDGDKGKLSIHNYNFHRILTARLKNL